LKELPKLEAQLAIKNSFAEVAAADSAQVAKPAEGDVEAESDVKAEPMALKASDAANDQKTEESSAEDVATSKADRFTVAKLGAAFYTRYLLAIEIAGTLLLVATIGAVVIAQREPNADAKETKKL